MCVFIHKIKWKRYEIYLFHHKIYTHEHRGGFQNWKTSKECEAIENFHVMVLTYREKFHSCFFFCRYHVKFFHASFISHCVSSKSIFFFSNRNTINTHLFFFRFIRKTEERKLYLFGIYLLPVCFAYFSYTHRKKNKEKRAVKQYCVRNERKNVF